ncbi:uncharacterized protein [Bombus flavifrons]|uniref:uncharacterized protein n=1 Tax=Bombus flavifrons TaxID=103934 RepID=UPI0037038734
MSTECKGEAAPEVPSIVVAVVEMVPRGLLRDGGSDRAGLSSNRKARSLFKQRIWQCLPSTLATLTMVIAGSVNGWTTISLLYLICGTGGVPLTLTHSESSWIVSFTVLGSMIGSLMAGQLASRSGRKSCLVLCNTMFTLGWYIIYATTSVTMLYLARGILGIGVGIAHTINPMYVPEVADINIRSVVNVSIGLLLTCVLGLWLMYESLLQILAIISFISFLSNTCFPETPYFSVATGQTMQARKSSEHYQSLINMHKLNMERHAQHAQTTHELHPQSTSELNQPSTSELNQPSTSELKQKSTSELNQPSTSELNQPSTSELNQPSTSELNQPSTSELNQPSTSELNQPSTSELNQPSTSELNQPSTSELNQPSTSEIYRSSTSEIHRSSTSEIHRSSTSEIPRSFTSEIPRSSTSELNQPSTSELNQPSTSELNQPSTSELNQPSTSELNQPSTSELNQPSTSELNQPSTSEIHRSSTSEIHRSSTSEIHRSSTSEIHRSSSSEILPDPTFDILPHPTCGILSRSTSDSCTQSNEDLRELADIDETHIDLTKYNLSTKLRATLQRSNRKALFIMLGLIMAQHLSGNFITMQYLLVLFGKTTISIGATAVTILVLAVGLISGTLSTLTVKSLGRKTLLILSTLGTCFTLTIVATYLLLVQYKSDVSLVSPLPVIDLIIYQVMFHIGLGTLPNVLLCELFPAELKGFVRAIIVIFDGIIGFTVPKLYQVITDNVGSYANYYIFATSCCLAFFMAFIWVPETKGKTYHEIEALLVGANLNSLNEEVRTDEMEIHRI